MSETNKAQSDGAAQPGLTAADLDRLAHEWSERRVVMNGIEFAEKADRARLERLKAALPSLLALARRGLEADGMIRIWEREETATEAILDRMGIPRRDDAPGDLHGDLTTPARVEITESKLAAALAEVERVRGRLESLRPTVRRFAEVMEQKLRDNHHKGGWDDCRPLDLLKRLFEEADELEGAIRDHGEEWNGHVVAREAADVANFAMMIADVCGGLKVAAEQAQAGQAAKQGDAAPKGGQG